MSIIVCCKPFKGKQKQFSENITYADEEASACFDITNKITSIVSDNVTNMVNILIIFGSGFKEISFKITRIMMRVENNDITIESSVEVGIPKHAKYSVHSLHLVVKDGLKEWVI